MKHQVLIFLLVVCGTVVPTSGNDGFFKQLIADVTGKKPSEPEAQEVSSSTKDEMTLVLEDLMNVAFPGIVIKKSSVGAASTSAGGVTGPQEASSDMMSSLLKGLSGMILGKPSASTGMVASMLFGPEVVKKSSILSNDKVDQKKQPDKAGASSPLVSESITGSIRTKDTPSLNALNAPDLTRTVGTLKNDNADYSKPTGNINLLQNIQGIFLGESQSEEGSVPADSTRQEDDSSEGEEARRTSRTGASNNIGQATEEENNPTIDKTTKKASARENASNGRSMRTPAARRDDDSRRNRYTRNRKRGGDNNNVTERRSSWRQRNRNGTSSTNARRRTQDIIRSWRQMNRNEETSTNNGQGTQSRNGEARQRNRYRGSSADNDRRRNGDRSRNRSPSPRNRSERVRTIQKKIPRGPKQQTNSQQSSTPDHNSGPLSRTKRQIGMSDDAFLTSILRVVEQYQNSKAGSASVLTGDLDDSPEVDRRQPVARGIEGQMAPTSPFKFTHFTDRRGNFFKRLEGWRRSASETKTRDNSRRTERRGSQAQIGPISRQDNIPRGSRLAPETTVDTSIPIVGGQVASFDGNSFRRGNSRQSADNDGQPNTRSLQNNAILATQPMPQQEPAMRRDRQPNDNGRYSRRTDQGPEKRANKFSLLRRRIGNSMTSEDFQVTI